MDYGDCFNKYEKFKAKRFQQKSRGLNDYNLFTSLLSHSDEVRLHSRFIYSIINPLGEHYQGTLFLELFLKSIGVFDFGLDLDMTEVYKEYNSIDLYITDGKKHIIIENKIFAGDQPKQITRYIETIANQNSGKNQLKDIYVVYLSLDRAKPSDDSIYGYTLEEGKRLVKNGAAQSEPVLFKAIHYNNEIRHWLEQVGTEVSNLSNLNQIISQYKDVISRLYNEYKGKCMSLKDFLGDDPEKWKMMDEFAKNRDELVLTEIDSIAKKLFKHLAEKQPAINDFQVCRKNGKMYSGAVYINLFLNNNVIIQLDYSSKKLVLRSVALQFHKLSQDQQKGRCAALDIPSFESHALAELICSEELQDNWVQKHDDKFIGQLGCLIKEYTHLK